MAGRALARLTGRRRVALLVLAGVVAAAVAAIGVADAQGLVSHVLAGSRPPPVFGLGRTGTGLSAILAAVVFVLLYGGATVVLVPKPLLNLAAGAWFGLAEGLPLAVVATTLGASASFLLGRAALRGRRFAFLERRGWSALDGELRNHGFRSVLAMRLLPVLPFAAINYGCAVGGTRPVPFAAATALGVLPGTAALVLAGATASAPNPAGTWASSAALALLTCVALVLRLRRRRAVQR